MKAISRREFIRTAAAATAVASSLSAEKLLAAEGLTVNGLPASVLGRTGLKVTKISLGGVLVTEPSVLARAVDSGINLVHIAANYNNGRSIEAFGKAFKQDKGLRKKLVLTVKARPEDVDKNLKILNTDYIDIIVPPLGGMKDIEDESIPEGFEKVKKAGKAGFLAWAGHKNTTEVFRRGIELGWFDATLMGYANITDPEFLKAAKEAKEAGIGIFTMKGLPKRFSEDLTDEDKATTTSLCGSMLNRQYADSVCASMGNFQAIDFFTDMMRTKLGYYSPELEQKYWACQQGSYCAMCGACGRAAPDGNVVQDIIRYRMYSRDYGMHDYARGCYSRLERNGAQLSRSQLELCEAACTRGLPIRKMVDEAHRMLG